MRFLVKKRGKEEEEKKEEESGRGARIYRQEVDARSNVNNKSDKSEPEELARRAGGETFVTDRARNSNLHSTHRKLHSNTDLID